MLFVGSVLALSSKARFAPFVASLLLVAMPERFSLHPMGRKNLDWLILQPVGFSTPRGDRSSLEQTPYPH